MNMKDFIHYVLATLASRLESFGYHYVGSEGVNTVFRKGNTNLMVGREPGSNAIDMNLYTPTLEIGYSLPEIAAWAHVDVPSLVARDEGATIAALSWLANFIESHCADLLAGDVQAIRALGEAAAEHNRRYHDGIMRSSVRYRARIAFEHEDHAEVVKLLRGLGNELSVEDQSLLNEASAKLDM